MDSNKAKQIEEQNKRIDDVLKKIKKRIIMLSGKGGIGKTTVVVNLPYTLLKRDKKVGLLDADITSPKVPKMMCEKSPPGIDQRLK